MNNFIHYHVHSELSLLDSADHFQDYIDMAVEFGMKALASTEHGNISNWTAKLFACKKSGIKYIHGCEVYLTETHENQIKDNFHTVLLAKNMDGVRELNELVSRATRPDHTYYKPRLSFDEFLSISDNIISTSACLGSPLNKLPLDHHRYMELVNKYDFLEIQSGNNADQIQYNQRLYDLSKKTGKPLIAGTDVHYSTEYKKECRRVLMWGKETNHDDSGHNLSFRDRKTFEQEFKEQNGLPEEVWKQAIDNTNLLFDMTEELELDCEIKYPISYGSAEKDAQMLREVCRTKFLDKLKRGVIPKEQKDAFCKAIAEELDIFEKLGMSGYMLSMSELMSFVRDSGMSCGFARGSVGGSRVAYVTDIIDLNPETWHTVFSRFCNVDRVEVGDIDVDLVKSDRPKILEYIAGKFGSDKIAAVQTFGTLQEKACINLIGAGLKRIWNADHPYERDNPWSDDKIAEISAVYKSNPEKAKKKYPELFYYFDGLLGVVVSSGVHAGGEIISPITLADNYGIAWNTKANHYVISLDMDACHDVNLVKYDLLSVKTVNVLNDAFRYGGFDFPKSHEIDWNDEKVWNDIISSPYGIFQFEEDYAHGFLRKFGAKSVEDMSLICAAIRPSGDSYRVALSNRLPHKNPSELIDELLKDNYGYLVYQEDIIEFLQTICGLTGSQADTTRRGIAKKKPEILEAMLPAILNGYCDKSDKPRDVAEAEAKEFIRIIEDSSSYMFGKNHSIAYCMMSYLTGWLRYYHPLEFITSFLNNAANDDDIANGSVLAAMKGVKILPPTWGYSRAEYFIDREKNIISKGLSSLKGMNEAIAEKLYSMSQARNYKYFVDILMDNLMSVPSANKSHIESLIKVDYFQEFGNQRELLMIHKIFIEYFRTGSGFAKGIAKDRIQGDFLEPIVARHSNGFTKLGKPAARFTNLDIPAILHEVEDYVRSLKLSDLSVVDKAYNFKKVMGYPGFVSNNPQDRQILYISKMMASRRREDGKVFGYTIFTTSIGSGKRAKLTISNSAYKKNRVKEDDIIYIPANGFSRNGQYFNLYRYQKLN